MTEVVFDPPAPSKPTYDLPTYFSSAALWEREGDYAVHRRTRSIAGSWVQYSPESGQTYEGWSVSGHNLHWVAWNRVLNPSTSPQLQRVGSVPTMNWLNFGAIPTRDRIDGILDDDEFEVTAAWIDVEFTGQIFTYTGTPTQVPTKTPSLFDFVLADVGTLIEVNNAFVGTDDEWQESEQTTRTQHDLPVPTDIDEWRNIYLETQDPSATWSSDHFETANTNIDELRVAFTYEVRRPIKFLQGRIDLTLATQARIEATPEPVVLPPHPRHVAKRRREQYRRPSHVLRLRGPA